MSLLRKLSHMANNELAQEQEFTLSSKAAAARRGVSTKVVALACCNGELNAVKKGSCWVIDEKSFKQWRPAGRGRKRT